MQNRRDNKAMMNDANAGGARRSTSLRKNPQVEGYDDVRQSRVDVMKSQAPESDTMYHISLQVKYKCNKGEMIGISGNIEELGFWKEFKYHLKWTEGDRWITK